MLQLSDVLRWERLYCFLVSSKISPFGLKSKTARAHGIFFWLRKSSSRKEARRKSSPTTPRNFPCRSYKARVQAIASS